MIIDSDDCKAILAMMLSSALTSPQYPSGVSRDSRNAARGWFYSGGPAFDMVCEFSGLCPARVRDQTLALIRGIKRKGGKAPKNAFRALRSYRETRLPSQ